MSLFQNCHFEILYPEVCSLLHLIGSHCDVNPVSEEIVTRYAFWNCPAKVSQNGRTQSTCWLPSLDMRLHDCWDIVTRYMESRAIPGQVGDI
jgi:uncharacterized protein YajQ (UPF0234 family)